MSLDQAPAATFVRDDRRSELFDGVGKRIVPDVVQQRRGDSHARITIGQPAAIGVAADVVDRQASQMHDAERVLEARVPGARPDSRDEPELLDALEPNERSRADQGEIRSTEGNPVVQGVADGRFDRESSGGSSPWLDHGAKDRPALNAVSATSQRRVCSAAWNGARERGQW